MMLNKEIAAHMKSQIISMNQPKKSAVTSKKKCANQIPGHLFKKKMLLETCQTNTVRQEISQKKQIINRLI